MAKSSRLDKDYHRKVDNFEEQQVRAKQQIKHLSKLHKQKYEESLKHFAEHWDEIRSQKREQEKLLSQYFKWQKQIQKSKYSQLQKLKKKLEKIADLEQRQQGKEKILFEKKHKIEEIKLKYDKKKQEIAGKRDVLENKKRMLLEQMESIQTIKNDFSSIDLTSINNEELMKRIDAAEMDLQDAKAKMQEFDVTEWKDAKTEEDVKFSKDFEALRGISDTSDLSRFDRINKRKTTNVEIQLRRNRRRDEKKGKIGREKRNVSRKRKSRSMTSKNKNFISRSKNRKMSKSRDISTSSDIIVSREIRRGRRYSSSSEDFSEFEEQNSRLRKSTRKGRPKSREKSRDKNKKGGMFSSVSRSLSRLRKNGTKRRKRRPSSLNNRTSQRSSVFSKENRRLRPRSVSREVKRDVSRKRKKRGGKKSQTASRNTNVEKTASKNNKASRRHRIKGGGEAGMLKVKLLNARNVFGRKGRKVGTYVELKIGRQKFKSSLKSSSSSPEWNEEFKFKIKNADKEELHLKLKDANGQVLSKMVIPVYRLVDNEDKRFSDKYADVNVQTVFCS